MSDIEEKITAARTRLTQAERARARAQAETDHAKAEQAKALDDLKKFGVSTPEEAAQLLKALNEQLDEALTEVETALQEAGA